MKTVKTVKRRLVQKTAEAIGKAEHVTAEDNNEFKAAVSNFRALEAEFVQILGQLKAARTAMERYTDNQAALSNSLSTFFSTDTSSSMLTSLTSSSHEFANVSVHAHDVLRRTHAKLIDDFACSALQQLLTERFPLVKAKIKQHDGLETDLSSYTRRVRNLSEKNKLATDPELIKFKEKEARARSSYAALHEELLAELKHLYDTRHDLLRRAYVSLVSVQAEFQLQMSDALQTKVLRELDRGDVQIVRDQFITLARSGGPGPELDTMTSSIGGGGTTLLNSFRKMSLSGRARAGSTGDSAGKAAGGGGSSGASASSNSKGSPSLSSSKSTAVPMGVVVSTTSPTARTGAVATSANPFAPPPVAEDEHDVSMGVAAMDEEVVECEVAVACFDYDGADEGDLHFVEGETILVAEKIDEGWWRGYNAANEFGLFPSNYVKLQEQ